MSNFFRILFLPITTPLDFIQKYFKALVFIFIVLVVFSAMDEKEQKEGQTNLAKIYLYGPILDASLFLEELENAKEPNIKGVLLVIDSPGGLVAPSIEISYAIRDLAKTKPVVVYSSGTMASGSYYAAIYANKIISNPGSLVGSIGVIFEGFNIKELAQKIGVKEQVVKAGKYKEIGTMMRDWEPHEKAEMEKLVSAQYKMFVSDVATARKLDPSNHTIYADAKVFTAAQAKEVGLVDEIGIISNAESEIISLSGVSEPIWQQDSEFEKFMKKFMEEATLKLASMIFRTWNY